MTKTGMIDQDGIEYYWRLEEEFMERNIRWNDGPHHFRVRVEICTTLWIDEFVFGPVAILFSPKLRKVVKKAKRILDQQWQELHLEKARLLENI